MDYHNENGGEEEFGFKNIWSWLNYSLRTWRKQESHRIPIKFKAWRNHEVQDSDMLVWYFPSHSSRVIILEDELEKLVSSKETQELTLEAYQVLEQKLKLIQPHIQASNSCWEEAISQVEKMVRRNPDKKGTLKSFF